MIGLIASMLDSFGIDSNSLPSCWMPASGY